MELCSHNHDEVCFERGKCPVCQMRDEMEEQLASAKEDKESAESEASEYKSMVASLEQQLQEKESELQRLYAGQSDGER